MELIRQVLMQNLIRHGVLEACGKPIEEASTAELNDEWNRIEMQRQA